MPLSTFEKILPWSGAVAGLAWVGQGFLFDVSTEDVPGGTSAAVVNAHLALNHAGQGCLVVMGIALLFFATSVRTRLRSGEAGEATYSSVAYGGLLVVVAGLSQMVVVGYAVINGTADAHDQTATRILGFVNTFTWAGMGIGLATALVAIGLGGIRAAVLPRWFGVVSVVLGVLGALGTAGIPPGGLVNYLLLPFWLVAASFLLARGPRARSSAPREAAHA